MEEWGQVLPLAPALLRDPALSRAAALLRQNGISRLYTHDRDFRKFTFLEVRDPL